MASPEVVVAAMARRIQLVPIASTALLMLSWLSAMISLGCGIALLAGNYSENKALHKLGFAIGLSFTLLLLFPTLYSLYKTTRQDNHDNNNVYKQGRTAFLRWQGIVAWLISTSIVITTAIILVQSQKKLPFYICVNQVPFLGMSIIFCQDVSEHRLDMVIVVICLLLGIFLHLTSLLIICKPRRRASKINNDDSSVITMESGAAMSFKAAQAYLDTLPQVDYYGRPHSRPQSIPRKQVDYMTYLCENVKYVADDFILDDEEEKIQIGHSCSSTSSNDMIKLDKHHLSPPSTPPLPPAAPPAAANNATLRTNHALPRQYQAKIANTPPMQSIRKFQSLDEASLKVRNSL